jgi:hypothetical protein
LGDTYKEVVDQDDVKGTNFVTVDLHKSASGIVHKVHRICIYEWFQQQLEQEPRGRDPNDITNIPFTCPLCKERISIADADNASGVKMSGCIATVRSLQWISKKSVCSIM